ncbi:hypothetical protein [Flavobacterium gilvum]|uniref:Carboxypeptidase-like regulatory domain-containing protein n=1 Tax=Flavobacterium gilvum TaxID=1492737 RepID=A0AAC9N722_9FLAO|nr:hypothetical protein [Flavobacterium gilvum]AOW09748.1 hypothetical protein EM308_09660 [Flavobacterium gilvum]KFC60395.1 hypothetical protein FEM08_08720 [Flavobacterium gilvum]
MKKILVLFHFLLSIYVFSQNNERTLILMEKGSNLPIEGAVVLVLKTKQVLMSNSEGKVVFELKGGSNVKVTHSSYLPVILKWTSLNQPQNIVYLNSKENTLDDIVVTKQHPQEIIKSLVENSIKKLTVPARLKSYSREFFKLNGEYAYYNDGLINFQLYKDQKKVKSVLLVEQNRSFGLIDDEISSNLLGYNLNNMMEKYYLFTVLRPLMDDKLNKKFNFVIKVSPQGEEFNEITAVPLEGTNEIFDDFKIVYDVKKKLIVEINAVVSPTTLAEAKEETGKGSKNITRSVFKTNYRIDMENYYLVSSKEEINFNINTGNDVKNIEVLNNLVTTNFNIQNYTYKESDVFKDKTLFNIKNSILTEYWNVSGLTPTVKELEIITNITKSF